MKKNTLQKLLSVVLVGAMTATMFAGCGKTEPEAPANDAANEPSANVVAGIDGFEPFAENVTIKIPVYDRGDSSNGCSDVVNNYWTNWVQENFGNKYNITVEYVGITRSDVMNDYTLLVASDQLPTICMEYDYPKLTTWYDEGYLQAYDMDELKTVAPTYYNNMVDANVDQFTDLGGEPYIVLGTRAFGFSTYTFVTVYRQDWLEEAGYTEYPTTASEQIELYKKLIENGHKAPLSGSKATGAGIDQNYGYRTYPQDEITWVTTGDYNIPALSTDAQKNFLKLQNYYYNNGMLNKEYALRETADVQADFINNQAFQLTGYINGLGETLGSFYQKNPDAKLAILSGSSKLDQDATWGSNNSYRPGSNRGAMFGFSKDATADQMKAVMMYIEWLSQDENLFVMENGIEGINFEYNADGTIAQLDDSGKPEQMGHGRNIDYVMIVEAIRMQGVDGIEASIHSQIPYGNLPSEEIGKEFEAQILTLYNNQKALYDAGEANEDALFAGAVAAESEYSQTLYDLYSEYRDKLVMCPEDQFDALYDEFSQKYLDAGYQAVIDERLEMYNNGLTSRLK